MKKILLALAAFALTASANAQFVVGVHLGGSYSGGTVTPTNTEYVGVSRLTGNDTVYHSPNDTLTLRTPWGVTGGFKFGYQTGRLQFGISGSFSWDHYKEEMSATEYYSDISQYSDCPYFIVNPTRIPDIQEWTGWHKWQQSSITIAPYVRYEVIQMGDAAFFLELNGYFKRSFQPRRHDFVDFYWLEMHNTIDSSFTIPDHASSIGLKMTPGLSWQLTPHCYVDLYLDVLALSYDRTTRTHVHTFETWDVIAEPNVVARREETTTVTNTTALGFDLNGTPATGAAGRSWVRVGFNYTF